MGQVGLGLSLMLIAPGTAVLWLSENASAFAALPAAERSVCDLASRILPGPYLHCIPGAHRAGPASR